MSQCHAQADSAPELAPFLPTKNQSGGWNQPTDAESGNPLTRWAGSALRAQQYAHSRIKSHPTHTCAACATSFPNNYRLEQHATKNKHQAYLCTCGKAFSKNSALKRHVEESAKAREHKCPKCDNEFKRPGHVEQHLRLIHRMSKDAIKDLLSARKLQSRQEPQQASTASTAASNSGSMDAQAGYPVVTPSGPWTGLINLSTSVPADHPGSRPGSYSAFSSGIPAPTTGPVTRTPAFSVQNFMTQARGFPAYPACPAGPVADQTGLPAIPAPDFAGYPAEYSNQDFVSFNTDPALTLNPIDGFEIPALETGFMGELFDFGANTFGF